MSKKTFISTMLLFAFTIVLAHNIIPHRHHQHEHSGEIQHHHHHDKQDHQDGDDNGLTDLFSHLIHTNGASEIIFTFSSNHNLQKVQTLKQVIKIADFVFRQLKIPIKPEPPHYILIASKQSFYSTHSLRGPPVLSV